MDNTKIGLLIVALTALAPFASAMSNEAASHIARGDDVTLADGALTSLTDIVVDGTLRAPAGGDLVLRATHDIIIRGSVLAGDASALGASGGNVLLQAGGAVRLERDATVQAGAGAPGAPANVPGGLAMGAAGGSGGDITIVAATTQLDGALLAGAGGRGGDAAGLHAYGGAGGAMGALLLNGVRSEPTGVVRSPISPSYTCAVTDVQPAGGVGANGGNACAQGLVGAAGANGADGRDDPKVIDKASWPDCIAYNPAFTGNFDGEQGQNAFPGLPGGPAVAVGGAGGTATSASMQAGNGGSATATGGAGGRGGNGGMGGNSNGLGNGCNGGNGGAGGAGGSASATGGAQGLNALDCHKNGSVGVGSANGGAGGAGGWAGIGGGGNWPYSNGASGSPGPAGPNGVPTATTPTTVPCITPDAPALTGTTSILSCTSVTLFAVAPANVATATIFNWRIYRGFASNAESYWISVNYSTPAQTIPIGGLTAGTTYYFNISLSTSAGETARSTEVVLTPHCPVFLPAPNDLTPIDLGNLTGSCLAPTLSVMGGLGSATLTITAPVTITGTPQYYKIFRGASMGGELFVTTTPYGGTTTTFVDTPVPSGATWYYVTLVTTSCESPPSNEAVGAVLMHTGGGSNNNLRTTETTMVKGVIVSTRTCSAVPVSARWAFGDAWIVDESYQAGTPSSRSDSPDLCAKMASETKTYDTETDPAAGCTDDMPSYGQGETYVIARSCSSASGGVIAKVDHRVMLSNSAKGWYFTEDARTTNPDGSIVTLHTEGPLAPLVAQGVA